MRPPDRRLVAVSVHIDLLINLMREGYRTDNPLRCINGVPDDAVFVGAIDDPRSLCVYYVFHHPSFDVVPEGVQIPVITVEVQTTISEADLLKKLDRFTKSGLAFKIEYVSGSGYAASVRDQERDSDSYTTVSPPCSTIVQAGEWIVDRVDLWNQ